MRRYKIADVVIEIHDDGKIAYPYFEKFAYSGDEKSEIVWRVVDEAIEEPAVEKWKDMKSFAVGKDDRCYYHIRYDLGIRNIKAVQYNSDFTNVTFYAGRQEWTISNDSASNEIFQVNREPRTPMASEVSFLFREAFFLHIQSIGGISMHSASLIYKGYGIAFSAVSGTGKSTHTNLWNQYYQTPILDGDVTVCRLMDGLPYIYGLPWAGSSGLMENRGVPLFAIVFINQSKECKVTQPNILQIMQRLMIANFTPTWIPEFHKQQVKNIKNMLSSKIYFYNLDCDISKHAVDVMKEVIDGDIEIS